MRSRLITDPHDPFGDGVFDTAWDAVSTNFFPATFPSSFPASGHGGGNPPGQGPVEVPLTPALTHEAVQSSGAQSGAISLVAMTSGGITINLLFDAAAMAAPSSFRAGIQQAASLLTASISDKITVNIKIDYSGTGGGAAAGPDNGNYENYSAVRTDLINNATSGDPTFNALPTGSTIQGQSQVAVWNAQLKLWGGLGASDTSTDDGSATFATDISSGLLVGVALHELTHAMGRVPYGAPYGSQPDIFDLFRFTSPGTLLIDGRSTATAAYFSVDGGNTKLADYGRTSDPSDFLNNGVQGSNDPFNEFYTGSTLQSLTTVDKEQLDALGFHTLTPVTTVIEAFGSTSLVQVGSYYYLDSLSTGSGPQLKYGGAPVVAGQFAPYVPVGVEQTAGGYEVALANSGTGQFSIWNTDSSGNFLSSSVYSGTSTALESLETSFHQDLNGDGVIGIPVPVTIEAFGSTSLVKAGLFYFLDSISSGTGPELKQGGVPFVAGHAGAWLPIGVEQAATGYEVAWKATGADQYSAWLTDSNGNYTTNSIPVVSGSSVALESLEPSFHQDLNGDGVIGMPGAVVIEANGSTELVQVGSNYYLNSISTGIGTELKQGGVPFVAGQAGAWLPIGVEQTAAGYEVAWKATGADQYSAWLTDSTGNYTTNSIPVVSGSSVALESLEPSFHQDLNGDGVIGVAGAVVIEANGSTELVQVGSDYYLNSISSGTGPELKQGGVPFVAGQAGAWLPIGVEQTATGYEVAWKATGADQYSAWLTDSNGNYTTNSIPVVYGSSVALESLEPNFHQDLNGDGVIGVPAATGLSASQRATVTVVSNDTFVFRPGIGAGTPSNAENAATFGRSGFFSPAGNLPQAFFHDEQSSLPQALSHLTNDWHDAVINPANHHGESVMSSALIDPNYGFIIR